MKVLQAGNKNVNRPSGGYAGSKRSPGSKDNNHEGGSISRHSDYTHRLYFQLDFAKLVSQIEFQQRWNVSFGF